MLCDAESRTNTKADHCSWSCPSLTDGVGRTCSCRLPGACAVGLTGFLPSKISAFTETLSAKKRSCDVGEASYGFVAPSTCGGVLSLPAYEWQNGCACAGC